MNIILIVCAIMDVFLLVYYGATQQWGWFSLIAAAGLSCIASIKTRN